MKASVHFNIFVECPHCNTTFDLISHDDNGEWFWTMKLRDWLNNVKGADKMKEDVLCPDCDKEVVVTEFEY